MKISCTSINNTGIYLSKNLINKAVYKYNGLLGRALFKLYDMGYQSSPAVFDLGDFRNALYDDFKDDINLLRNNVRGNIDIDDEYMIKYAMVKTYDDSFRKLLSTYLDILTAQKALKAYNTLLSRIKVPKKNDVFKIKPRLGVSGKVGNFNNLPLDLPYIRECFVVEEENQLYTYNTSDILVKEIVKRLGYSDKEYNLHKDSGQAFFVSGISQKVESELLSVIISGKIEADGKFGIELTNDIEKYYNEFYSTHDSNIHCLDYEEVIFNNALDERISLINKKRSDLGDRLIRPFYVTTNDVIFVVSRDISGYKNSYFKGNKLNLGTVTLSHENRCEFHKINTLCGLCGEFIHESTVTTNNWISEGLPISIKFGMINGKKFKLSELNYYPIYNVYYNEDSSSIRPLLGNDIHITIMTLEELEKKFGTSSKREVFYKCLKATDVDLPAPDVNRQKYEELVADLTTALIFAECGELEYELYKTGYTWVNDEIFYRASTEAEDLFKSFGF